jgi:ureidoacrylate peracid hydrolase
MHKFEMPKEYVERVTARQGRPHTCETFDTRKTALVVVDMQHFFMVEPYMMACPVARDIVPNVNRLARAVRKSGGKVVWIQNLAPWQSVESWAALHERFQPESRDLRIQQMQKDHHGFQLWPGLEVLPEDERVIKRRYSAFIHGSSDIENVLKDNGIETIIVTGVATNVCCESTARDAMMLNYRTMMVSDGCAAASDELHAGALGNFYLQFGDVQTTDEIIARLDASQRKNA